MNAAKKKKLLTLLDGMYENPKSELHFRSQYQLLVCVMLSAQTTDKKVNEITPELFGAFPSFSALRQAKLRDIEKIIRPINYYKTKAKHLRETSGQIVEKFNSRLPRTYEKLTALPGIGNKTANVILCELGIAPALPVDTHVFRVSKRLGIAQGKTPEQVEDALKKAFSHEHWRNLHHWLIFHGRRVCKAQRPQCSACQLASLCPSNGKAGTGGNR